MSDALSEEPSERRIAIEALFANPGEALVTPSPEVQSEERERDIHALASWYLEKRQAESRDEAEMMARQWFERQEAEA